MDVKPFLTTELSDYRADWVFTALVMWKKKWHHVIWICDSSGKEKKKINIRSILHSYNRLHNFFLYPNLWWKRLLCEHTIHLTCLWPDSLSPACCRLKKKKKEDDPASPSWMHSTWGEKVWLTRRHAIQATCWLALASSSTSPGFVNM